MTAHPSEEARTMLFLLVLTRKDASDIPRSCSGSGSGREEGCHNEHGQNTLPINVSVERRENIRSLSVAKTAGYQVLKRAYVTY